MPNRKTYTKADMDREVELAKYIKARRLEVGKAVGIKTDVEAIPPQRKRPSKKSLKRAKHAQKVQSDNFLESYEWRKLRYKALLKHGAKCMCCGRTRKNDVTIHVDHIKPRKTHPELALKINNLQILCHECNHGKGNWDQTDWR